MRTNFFFVAIVNKKFCIEEIVVSFSFQGFVRIVTLALDLMS